MGIERFMRTASDSGVNGIVVPDLPMEEADAFRDMALKHNLDNIYLAAPTHQQRGCRASLTSRKGSSISSLSMGHRPT